MRRSRVLPVPAAVFVAFTLVMSTAAHGASSPQEGVYHGLGYGAASPCKTNEGEGWFRLKRGQSGKLKIVPPRSYPYAEGPATCHGPMYDAKITAPSDLDCNPYNADLPINSIKVKKGSFDWSGKAPIGPNHSKIHVRFKGHWVDGTHVKGYTRVRRNQCDSGKFRWTMHKLP